MFLKIKTLPFRSSTLRDAGSAGKRLGRSSESQNRLTLAPPTERKSYSMNMASSLVAVSDALILLATGFLICWYYVGMDSPTFGYYPLAIILVTIPVILHSLKQTFTAFPRYSIQGFIYTRSWGSGR